MEVQAGRVGLAKVVSVIGDVYEASLTATLASRKLVGSSLCINFPYESQSRILYTRAEIVGHKQRCGLSAEGLW